MIHYAIKYNKSNKLKQEFLKKAKIVKKITIPHVYSDRLAYFIKCTFYILCETIDFIGFLES